MVLRIGCKKQRRMLGFYRNCCQNFCKTPIFVLAIN